MSKKNKTLNYRPDIDGLRAWAVCAVILFHASVPYFSGGFVGVDVFFVISGYLIGSIIFNNIQNGKFSFFDFYLKRVKRIFPTLIVVLISSLVFGFCSLFPEELMQLGRHTLAGAGFFSNFQLWSEVGYFDIASDKKPLLHLWSLAIEEQFYILAPIIFFFLIKWLKRFVSQIIFILTLASFVYCLHSINIDPTKSFYAPASRFWEILIGCLIASLQQNSRIQLAINESFKKFLLNLISATGFIILLYAILKFNKQTIFPGWNALLPILSVVLLILGGERSFFNKALLSTRAAVHIGKISYPLYLWHWPLLAFSQILSGGQVSFRARFLCIALTFILSEFTYRYIEFPLRFKFKIKKLFLFGTLSGCLFLIGGLGAITELNSGFPGRYKKLTADTFSPVKFNNEEFCKKIYPFARTSYCGVSDIKKSPSVMILGDSHSRHFFHGLSEYYSKKQQAIVSFGRGGCPPFLGISRQTEVEGELNCDKINDSAISYVEKTQSIHTTVLAASFNDYIQVLLA